MTTIVASLKHGAMASDSFVEGSGRVRTKVVTPTRRFARAGSCRRPAPPPS